MKQRPLRTTVIGSYPLPAWLELASQHLGEFGASDRTELFDDAVTAPLHGFLGADDYYAKSSAGPLLGAVRAPTLLLHAANDPFLPASALPRRERLPAAVLLEVHAGGGHVGFVDGALPGRIDWLPQRLLAHFFTYMPVSIGMR